ncbi:MAG: hypothetical protein ACREKL_07230 [Chthoniobacterales bacterium]
MVALALGIDAVAGTMPMAKNPPKLLLDATRSRSTKTEGGDFDDKTQIVQLNYVVKNGDLNAKSVEGLTLHYWAIAQSAADRKAYEVIEAGSAPVKLDNTQQGREMRVEGEPVKLMLDNTGVARFGAAYKGFLMVVVNAQNEVVAVKGTMPSWQTNLERAFALKKNAWCGLDLKPIATPKD